MTEALREHPRKLLPWYVNGTLEDDEQRLVEEHLGSCLVCRREVEELRAMRRQIRSARQESPGQDGLRRLLEDVGEEDGRVSPWRNSRGGKTESRSSRPRPLRFRPFLPIAAVTVLALGWGIWQSVGPRAPVEVRAADPAPIIALVSPEEALPRDAFLLRWELTPEWQGARFTVRVTTAKLVPVAEARDLEESRYLVPASALADLPAGTRLLWQVEAVRPGEAPVRSQTFQVGLEGSNQP